MTAPWSAGQAPVLAALPGAAVTLIEGSTFCISEPGGDIVPGQPQGLFIQDTRVLSRWTLTVDGRAAEPVTVQQADPHAAAFIGRLPPPPGAPADAAMLVTRQRYLGDGMREDIAIRNTARQPAALEVMLTVGADFADLFDVKAGLAQPAATTVSAAGSTLTFDAHSGEHRHGLLVRGDEHPAAAGCTLAWRTVVPARGEWLITVEAVPVWDGIPMTPHHPPGQPAEHAVPARRLREWRHGAPRLRAPDHDLAAVLRRSIEDIGDADVLLGSVGGCPVYIDDRQYAVWKHTQLIIDVGEGEPEGFSLPAGDDRHFVTRSRVFSPAELAALRGSAEGEPSS